MTADFFALPKAELHLHLEGAIRPSTAAELADRYGRPVPPTGRFADLTAFTVAYERARDLVGSLDDLRRIAREIVEDARAQGVAWTEVHLFPATYAGRLGPDAAVLDAVLDGLADGADDHSAAAVILGVNRGLSIEAAERTVDLAASRVGAGVVGLGLAGDEANFPPDRFAEVFGRAAAVGLPAMPHAGEGAGAESVRACLDLLHAKRINHGVRAVDDPALLARLADEAICLDVCPSSNVALRVVDSLAEHPLPELIAAGVPVSLGSDCPLFCAASLVDEYRSVADLLGVDAVAGIAEASLQHSFCPPERRTRALGALADWHSLLWSSRTTNRAPNVVNDHGAVEG